jgi:integrase/recombinase XerD
MLGKQAKILTEKQQKAVLDYLEGTRYPLRNQLIFLFSFKAGLRAKEIASLTWAMVCNSDGEIDDVIRLQDIASKGKSGRIIPMNKDLKAKLIIWKSKFEDLEMSDRIIRTERSSKTTPQVIVNFFQRLYDTLGLDGCSSHSGRRTFITNASRKITTVGGSLKDVQMLAGHSNIMKKRIHNNADPFRCIIDLLILI